MGYNCVVCVKQVPDTKKITGDAMQEDGTVNRAALAAIFNPEDRNALEQALAIKDTHGGTVTVLTMGRPEASDLLRESLYRGVDRVIVLTDRRAAASDTLATSYILGCAIRSLSADIVLCGRQAIDGDTAQVGPQLAEKLNLTPITYLDELIGLEQDTVTVRRSIGNGYEIVAAELPVLITVMDTANVPRPPASRRMMKFKKARCRGEIEQEVAAQMENATEQEQAAEVEARCNALDERGLLIEQWGLDDFEVDLNWCGRSGSPTKVHRIQSIVLTGGDYKQFEPTGQGVAELIGELIEDHTIG